MSTKKKQWTEQEQSFLNANRGKLTLNQIAKHLGRTLVSVGAKSLRTKSLPKKGPTVAPDSDESLVDFWKKECGEARRKLAEQTREKTTVDLLVEKAVELAPVSYKPAPAPVTQKPSTKWGGRPQSAVLVFSDSHIGQVIAPDQTLGLGGYNFDVFLRRLQRLEKSVFSILEDHTTTRVPEIVVAMLGDMLHGNLQHAVEAGQVNTLFTQFYSAGHAIAQFLRNISTLAPVRIETAVGNHPRWATQRKMPADNRFSNLDQFLYAYVEALLRDVPTIKFNLTKQPFALFQVQGHHFYAGHGDHLRGGDRILGVPNHAIGRNLSNTSQMFGAAGKPFPNYFLFGHFHRPITLPHSNGEVIINGGFPGLDGFALMEAFNSSHPSQKLFLMHPKFGRSACYDLRLDFGDNTPHNYQLPDEFLCA